MSSHCFKSQIMQRDFAVQKIANPKQVNCYLSERPLLYSMLSTDANNRLCEGVKSNTTILWSQLKLFTAFFFTWIGTFTSLIKLLRRPIFESTAFCLLFFQRSMLDSLVKITWIITPIIKCTQTKGKLPK